MRCPSSLSYSLRKLCLFLQAKKDAKLQAKLELKQAKEEELLNLEHAKVSLPVDNDCRFPP